MKRISFWMLALAMICGCRQGAAQNDSVPFLYRGHLYVHAVIISNNDTIGANVAFDTGGADIFGVDSVWLAHSQWHPERLGYAKTGGGAGSALVRIILDPSKVNIGSIEENYNMMPVFQLRDVLDCHADGLWGIKNISDYPFEINFEKGYLKRHKTGLPGTEGYMRLPIKYENNRIYVQAEVTVGGQTIKGWYLMDTGSGATVDFTAQTVRKYRLDTIPGKRYVIDVSQFGIGDKKQEYYVDMMSDRIVIGQDTVFEKPISYIPEGTGAFGENSYVGVGVIGNGIWSKCNMIIDAKNKVLYLRRFKPETSPKPRYDYDFRNRTDIGRGWIVSALTREGDAVNAGMDFGDTIITVNGRPVDDYSWEEEYNIDEQPRQVLEIIGADGRRKQITLEAKLRW